jgi:alkylhydroperoxidase family enzyme
MGRLPLVDPDDPAFDTAKRDALRAASGAGSIPPNVFRAIANHPQIMEATGRFASVACFRNSLTPAQRELAYLTASVVNDCHY